MVKHIGIVACSAEGAALCYQTICREGADIMGKHSHPEITMHTYPLSEYMRYIKIGDWDGVADLMVSSARKVAKVGADFIICPDNTIHQAFERVVKETSIPWLHIAEEVAAEAESQNYRTLGVLGTLYLMEGPVYPSKLNARSIKHQIPEIQDRKRINEIIFNELVNGRFTVDSRTDLTDVIYRFKNQGCDAVILGCTELPMIINCENSSLPILDSTRLLARAALKKATTLEG